SSHVFMTERDGPMTPKSFHALFGRIGARAKMPFPIHPHMLRHGWGYALANAGHDTRALQAWLGPKNIQHTVRYTELAPARFKNFWRHSRAAAVGLNARNGFAATGRPPPPRQLSCDLGGAPHHHHHSETGRCQSPKVSLACLRKCQSRFGGSMPSTSAETTQPCCSSLCSMPGRYSAASPVACSNS